MSIRIRVLFFILNYGLIFVNLSLMFNHGEGLWDKFSNERNRSLSGNSQSDRKGMKDLLKYVSGLKHEREQISGSDEQKVSDVEPDSQCNFEGDCSWEWKTEDSNGFFVSTVGNNIQGLEVDADNKSTGHFLLLQLKPSSKEFQITSPDLRPSLAKCRIQLWIFQKDMVDGMINIVAETVVKHTQWIVNDIRGNNNKKWTKYDIMIGIIARDFKIILEVVSSQRSAKSAVVAFDNLKLLECFPESDRINSCTSSQYRCIQSNVCINTTRICDIDQNCKFGDDEFQNCDKIPYGARCNFEQDWCGWYNTNGKVLQWMRHNGTTPSNKTGPSYDHTYGNATGMYMYVNGAKFPKDVGFASSATLNSIIFNPPPSVHGNFSSKYYNSCTIRFYLYQFGTSKSGVMLQLTEIRAEENVTFEILWSFNDFGDKWMRNTVFLPNITHKYYLHFDVRNGKGYTGDVAIDDFSMSPECFGLNIPQSELNNYNYLNPDVDVYPNWVPIIFSFVFLLVTIAFGFVCFKLYTRYQRKFRKTMTQYNPIYEKGGSIWSVKDLKKIPRSQLVIQKVIGKGHFGEVYQGLYRRKSGDDVEILVAVKTLSAKLNQDVKVDFCTEALIMGQFNHPNIVHLIGVCFDKHPQFIVLELLAGGDLKKFLRESRPLPGKSSSLTMKDLVLIAIDVAKGCLYMESNHFIHRDIAARNCLLTMEGSGRLAKIADFGMSRDIYRSDYYRKDGKAMLPIKWMPPEAFLDGIFTSKTDVWSFGVLLWEITSMGYEPYTECGNRQVIELVANGGRLESPENCPDPIFSIMKQCWRANPKERPNFSLILERLSCCLQDHKVIGAPLPIFTCSLSEKPDLAIMGPENDHCIEIDKLIIKKIKTDKIQNRHLANLTNMPKPTLKLSSLNAKIPTDTEASVKQSFLDRLSNVNAILEDKLAENEVVQNGPCSLPKEI